MTLKSSRRRVDRLAPELDFSTGVTREQFCLCSTRASEGMLSLPQCVGWLGHLPCGHPGEERDEPRVTVSELFEGNVRGRQ